MMDVRIIKSSKDTYWYADKIGLKFEVTGVHEHIYEVRKWIDYPRKYDTAPVLKVDCKEIHGKAQPVEPRRTTHWKAKAFEVERKNKLGERSGFKTSLEINLYEKLNKGAEIKVSRDDDK